jgi:hypothetical protein
MADHISPWEIQARANAEQKRAEFESRPDFVALVAEATKRGYRRINLLEQLNPGSIDAYTWCGGVWVKND